MLASADLSLSFYHTAPGSAAVPTEALLFMRQWLAPLLPPFTVRWQCLNILYSIVLTMTMSAMSCILKGQS